MQQISFWTGAPELDVIKRRFETAVDLSPSKYREACKKIANNITINPNLSFSVNFNKPLKFNVNCLLIYGDLGVCPPEISGLARFTKRRDSIYIDQLTGFNNKGADLLLNILANAKNSGFVKVEIQAASCDIGLVNRYKDIGKDYSPKVEGESTVIFEVQSDSK